MTEATPLASEQITQEDREAAAAGIPAEHPYTRLRILDGVMDHHHVVQDAARHRIAALSASPAPSGQGVSGEVDLPTAARLALMYLETGFIGCPQCGHEVPTKDLDAVWQIKDGLATPAPSCAPGEVERLRAAVKLTVADASHHLRKWRPHCLEALEAALSPQGLDAKEGGE